jgi:uncharacterized membrane protein
MFSDFPNLHPLVVHFPIVLILLGAAMQALLVFKDSPPLRWGTLIIMGAAFASALLASKIFHAHTAELPSLADEIYQDHEKYAAYTLWISGLTFLLRGIGEFYLIRRRSYESLVLASALVAAMFLSLTGHRGAQLVYLAGVGPKGHLVLREDQAHEHGGHPAEKHSPASMPGHEPAGHPSGHGDSMAHHQTLPGASKMANMDHTGRDLPGGSGNKHPMPENGQHPASHSSPDKSGHTGAAGHETMPGMQHPVSPKPGNGHVGMPHSLPATGNHQQMQHSTGQNVKTDRYGRPLIDPTEPYDNNPAREQTQSPSRNQ